MKIYLAARYSRRQELCGYRQELQRRGYAVTSRWLDGQHQISDAGIPIGEQGERLVEQGRDDDASSLRQAFAREDVADVMAADMLIAFTEPPRAVASRGGRHVELGLALGAGKAVCVVGHRENIFCWLDDVAYYPQWAACLRDLPSLHLPQEQVT